VAVLQRKTPNDRCQPLARGLLLRDFSRFGLFLGCFLLRFASYKTRELSMTVAELGLRSGYGLSPRTLRRDLKPQSGVGRVRVEAGPAHPLQVPYHAALGKGR
jgi:hypothetical protein